MIKTKFVDINTIRGEDDLNQLLESGWTIEGMSAVSHFGNLKVLVLVKFVDKSVTPIDDGV